MRTKKIFVGGLSATTSLEDIKAYFEQFSKVEINSSAVFISSGYVLSLSLSISRWRSLC